VFQAIKALSAITLAAALASCSSQLVTQRLDADTFYPRDVKLTINGVVYNGVAAPPAAEKYEIKVEAKGSIDTVTFTSCHRDVPVELEPPKRGEADNVVYWTYRPVKGIEDREGCSVDVAVYEKSKGRHGWGFIAFQAATVTIPAELQCDGLTRKAQPTSVCHAKSGLIQRIAFGRRMKMADGTAACPAFQTKDEKTYEYAMPKGECDYYFCSKERECHRLTTLGYDGILIRSE